MVLVMVFEFPVSTPAQQWSGILAPSRASNWSKVGTTIPANRTQCGATIAAYSGSAANINAAIAGCGANQYVQLGAGTFNLSTGITFGTTSNVTLRGAGANQTFLYFTGADGCSGANADICVSGSNNYRAGANNIANWIGGYSTGTTSITLNAVPNLSVGSVLILDQCDDGLSGSALSASFAGCGTGVQADPGTVWSCSLQPVCVKETPSGSARLNRDQEQFVKVTSISGKGPYTLGISPGLYMANWNSARSPGAWWGAVLTGDGIEDLSVDHSGSLAAASGITFLNTIGCWVKGVRNVQNRSVSQWSMVWVNNSAQSVVRDSYFYGSGPDLYGIALFGASDALVENNILEHVPAPLNVNGACPGCVISYNFSVDDYYQYSATWQGSQGILHSVEGGMLLWEGNQGSGGFEADFFHGSHYLDTLFRNQWYGYEPGKSNNTIPIQLMASSRYFNIIGNVLGFPGFHTNYKSVAGGTSDPNGPKSILSLGWTAQASGVTSFLNQFCLDFSCAIHGDYDPLTNSTAMLWGNYDVATGGVRWCGDQSSPGWSTTCKSTSEIPSGIPAAYANPVPAGTTLPPSFYLGTQPGFWTTAYGTPPWPAIGPDVTSGDIPNLGGFAHNIPSQLCYFNASADSNYGARQSVVSIVESGTTAKVTLSSTAGPTFTSPSAINISGSSAPDYNHNWTILSVSGNTVTFTAPPGLATASGGTAAARPVLTFNASSCYGSPIVTPPVSSPTNLKAIVH